MDDFRATNLRNWESRVPVHASSRDYNLAALAADPARLSPVVEYDKPWLGDLTGLDAASAGVAARFVESELYATPEVLPEQFDLVYTGVGALNWLPEIAGWARVVAALLRPGGRLYVRDQHPMFMTLWGGPDDNELRRAGPSK